MRFIVQILIEQFDIWKAVLRIKLCLQNKLQDDPSGIFKRFENAVFTLNFHFFTSHNSFDFQLNQIKNGDLPIILSIWPQNPIVWTENYGTKSYLDAHVSHTLNHKSSKQFKYLWPKSIKRRDLNRNYFPEMWSLTMLDAQSFRQWILPPKIFCISNGDSPSTAIYAVNHWFSCCWKLQNGAATWNQSNRLSCRLCLSPLTIWWHPNGTKIAVYWYWMWQRDFPNVKSPFSNQ